MYSINKNIFGEPPWRRERKEFRWQIDFLCQVNGHEKTSERGMWYITDVQSLLSTDSI